MRDSSPKPDSKPGAKFIEAQQRLAEPRIRVVDLEQKIIYILGMLVIAAKAD